MLLASALVAAVATAGCGGGSENSSPTSPSSGPTPAKPAPATIKIGASVPQTGRYGATGLQVKIGYELAVEEINKAGGVMVKEYGKKIPLELIVKDDESDPTKAVAALESLNDKDQVVAYLGGFGSDMHAASAAIAEKNKIPYLGIAFALEAIHQKGYKYLFSPFPKSSAQVEVFTALKELAPAGQYPKTAAIFQEKTDYGKEQAAYFKSGAEANGIQVVVFEEYAPGTKDYADLVGKAKSAGAEMVLAVPTPPDGMTIAKQIVELQYHPKVIFFIRAPDAPTWGQNLKEIGDNVLFAPGWHHTAKFPGVDRLNEMHRAKYNKPAEAGAGPAYACVQILVNAIERAGSLDRNAIRDAIASTDLQTTVGKVKFDDKGIGSSQWFLNQWQNGKVENVWPKDAASAKLVFPAK